MQVLSEFKKHYRDAKGEITGKAVSRARMVKNAIDIPGMLSDNTPAKGPAHPIAGAYVRMHDKKPMQFHTDGSLRHVLPLTKPGKALRKQLKRQRQAKRAASSTTTADPRSTTT